MILSRRQLFRSLKDNLIENLQDLLPFILPEVIQAEKKWVSLGNISDFPPDYSTTVNNGKHILISKSEGYYVLNLAAYKAEKKEPRQLIRFNKEGCIMMNTIEICPPGTVLSVLLGELVKEEEL